MSVPVVSRKESLWLSCKRKDCCHAGFVIPTGRDVWRIARALETPPWSFAMYFATAQARRDAFALDQSEKRYRIALGKRKPIRAKAPPPCIFLLRTRQGHHRCGLGDLRPSVCKSILTAERDGILYVENDAGCTCRDWSIVDVDVEDERSLLHTRQDDGDHYCAVVADWNKRVETAPSEQRFDFFQYCTYLLDTYDAIAAGGHTEESGA
jgi:Fe-S-cluster containining protein